MAFTFMPPKVNRVEIPSGIRAIFELYGFQNVSFALVMGQPGPAVGILLKTVNENPNETKLWLKEQRQLIERDEWRREMLEWAVLIFVVMGTVTELAMLFGKVM
jgi:hypothetical protein